VTRSALRVAPVALLASIAALAVSARLRHPHVTPTIEMGSSAPQAPVRLHVASIAMSASTGVVPPGPVRMQHGDRRRSGRSPAHGPSQLRVRWRTPDLGAIEAEVVSSPDETTLYVDTLDGNLVALARADGAVRFRVPLGGRSYATPCVDDRGNVYAASDAKKLFAVRPDGHVMWTLDLDDEGDTACAIADDGTLVFAAGRTLYGVTQTGSVAWRFLARGKIFTAPAIDDRRRVLFGSQDHHVYAVEPSAPLAHKAWSVDLGADVDGSPAIDDDGTTVVGTDAGEVVRLDADGSVVWSSHVFGFVRGALSIARGGDVLAGVYGPHSRVVRLDGKTGVEKASFDVPGSGAAEFGVHGAPIEDAAFNLYFGAEDDRVYAVAPSGAVASSTTGGDVDAPVTLLSDGALVVASDDGAVYYLEP